VERGRGAWVGATTRREVPGGWVGKKAVRNGENDCRVPVCKGTNQDGGVVESLKVWKAVGGHLLMQGGTGREKSRRRKGKDI